MLRPHKSKFVTLVSWVSLVTGILCVITWLFHFPSLEDYFPGYLSMRLNTGICFTLSGLTLLQTQTKFTSRKLFIGLSLFVALFAALSLSQTVFGYDAGIDQLLVKDYLRLREKHQFPGRMVTKVAASFVLLG